MHTQSHLLQWLSLSIPTVEERPFILRGISTPRSGMVKMASNFGDAKTTRLDAPLIYKYDTYLAKYLSDLYISRLDL